MSFYLRKSIKAGPFRFNLSKSGIGVSAGIPGFRVGSGPRGNYVHIGRGGVYYRATLGARSQPHRPQPTEPPERVFAQAFRLSSGVVMEDVTGSTAFELEPTSSDDVVEQLNGASSRVAWGWWVTGAAFLLGLVTLPFGLIVWALAAPGCAWLVLNDRAHKTVVLFYDVHDEHLSWFDSVVTQWAWLTDSQRVWRVLESGAVITTYQFKTNSGAGSLLSRVTGSATTTGPKELATNIAVPSIRAGNAALYFLPDRALVREGKHFSDIGYAHLHVSAGQTRFIENAAPPGDAVQVDHTWQYVNVKGGPDRRYKDNRQLPVMRYSTLDITSSQGLQWQLQVSRDGSTAAVATALSARPGPQIRTASESEARRISQCNAGIFGPRGADPAPTATASDIPRALLTRTPTKHTVDGVTFTAIDIETTGLDPGADQIVEIGLVKFTADGTVLDEFATLVNSPGSSVGAREVHGIDDADLTGAPCLDEALPEAFAFMAGTALVAHNLDFEGGFLSAAAVQTRLSLPPVLGLCTLQTSRRQLEGRAFSLTAMYKTATGGWNEQRHTALGDARAVREVLLWLLRTSPHPLYLTQAPPDAIPVPMRQCAISCRPVGLSRASVAELLDAFPQSPVVRVGDRRAISQYQAVLTDAVKDGRLTYEEAAVLTDQARLTRLTGTQLRQLHRKSWEAAFPDHSSDWTALSATARKEMYLLADALGLTDLAEELRHVIEASAEPPPSAEARYLRGLRIAILGDHSEIIDLRREAESYGARLAVNITKTVRWLATSTPEANDSRHTTARTLGIPIISLAEARTRLTEAVREAELKAFERQRQIDEQLAQSRQREAEADLYWRPTWRSWELDYDPPRQPWSD
ncbi:DUF4236 domain-containing protein [Mycolicibacter hiberniae]|uniref:Uncharacterized protein n=1 Tax=Mycolicibacter hiberniae TaxID=29314 RepID=A0A7I7X3X6_9MYCO|nr:DUF4236 domain-containing protein [Mycolicibacter hiberniae]MCV7084617.1 DUF4236 domain-containing protein [Mycolicibacter hiberniae]ORV66556.1 hypothetical protein AWC09_20075 [Mycolicibacter hiberniae]BBZ24314.1 hypothetical protein MHIB_27320 [Mycolicibacter hiberniae]